MKSFPNLYERIKLSTRSEAVRNHKKNVQKTKIKKYHIVMNKVSNHKKKEIKIT